MKTSSENTPLDIFIRESLKADVVNITPFDWSEIEVLLRREPKSIPVEINKRTLTYSIAGILGMLLILGLVKVIQHYSSLAVGSTTPADSAQSVFTIVDTAKTTTVDTVKLKTDSIKLNTVAIINASSEIDSSKEKNDVDSTALKTANDKKAIIIPKVEKKGKIKKSKKDTLNSNMVTPPTETLPTVDTSSKKVTPEVKIDAPALSDTANKKITTPKTSSKKKKAKSTKNTAALPEQPLSVPATTLPSDSLK